MQLSAISNLGNLAVNPGDPDPKRVEQAAREFESLLIAEMLRSARETESSGLGDEESKSEESTMQDIADQQFAQLLAQNGGIGMTRLVVSGLSKKP